MRAELQELDLHKSIYITDKGLESLRGLNRLRFLYIASPGVTGKGLEVIGTLAGLERLVLDGCPIGDEGWEHLRGLKNLHTLALARTKITDRALERLPASSLEYLDLSVNAVTDKGIVSLTDRLLRLRRVDLSFTQVSDKGVATLRKAVLFPIVVIR